MSLRPLVRLDTRTAIAPPGGLRNVNPPIGLWKGPLMAYKKGQLLKNNLNILFKKVKERIRIKLSLMLARKRISGP